MSYHFSKPILRTNIKNNMRKPAIRIYVLSMGFTEELSLEKTKFAELTLKTTRENQ